MTISHAGLSSNIIIILIKISEASFLSYFLFFLATQAVCLKHEDGFHVDLDDYLLGLLNLASEMVSDKLLAVNGKYNCMYLVFVISRLS